MIRTMQLHTLDGKDSEYIFSFYELQIPQWQVIVDWAHDDICIKRYIIEETGFFKEWNGTDIDFSGSNRLNLLMEKIKFTELLLTIE